MIFAKIKNKLKTIILDNYLLKKIYFLYLLLRMCVLRVVRLNVFIEINRRKKVSIFNYKHLAKPVKIFPLSIYSDCNFYGLYFVIKNNGFSIYNTYIEHGIFFGDFIQTNAGMRISDYILTYSRYRKDIIRKYTRDKSIHAIGNYMKYIPAIFSNDVFLQEKNKLGRVLLVFPSHSIDTTHSQFDVAKFINYIKKIKINFDNILICLYWKDILLGRDQIYLDEGFKIVTAGHIYDFNFLSRLKFIISLADYTISNDIGTHIFYCLELGKPHQIINQRVNYEYIDDNGKLEKMLRDNNAWETYYNDKQLIMGEFKAYTTCITEQQYRLAKHYGGVGK